MLTVTCLPTAPVRWQPISTCSFTDALAVFRLPLPNDIDSITSLLSAAEQARAQRYHRPIDQLRFVAGRGLLRTVVGQYTRQPANQIVIDIGPTQKPALRHTPDLHVNLAHAGGWIMLAVSDKPVGIDVEAIDYTFDYQLITESSFSQIEQQAIQKAVDPRRAFYESWTRKEALVKATGTGITDNFDQIPALIGPHSIPQIGLDDAGSWIVQPFAVNEQHPAAIAYRPSIGEVFFFNGLLA